MDPVTTVAVSTATALATAMATDGWTAAKAGVMKVFRRAGDSEAEIVDAELARVEELLRAGGDVESIRSAAYKAWISRFQQLLAANPELAAELRAELGATEAGAVHQYNRPTDGGTVNAPIHGDVNNWLAAQDESR